MPLTLPKPRSLLSMLSPLKLSEMESQNTFTSLLFTLWLTVETGPTTEPVKFGITAHQANATFQSLWPKSGDMVAGATSQLWDEVPDQFWTNSIMLATFCPGVTGAPLWMVSMLTQATFAMPLLKTSTSTSDGIWPLWA